MEKAHHEAAQKLSSIWLTSLRKCMPKIDVRLRLMEQVPKITCWDERKHPQLNRKSNRDHVNLEEKGGRSLEKPPSVVSEVSHWNHPVCQGSVQCDTEVVTTHVLWQYLPIVTMQNKCTQKWHKKRKTIVCFKARKTVTKSCLQRIMLISSASDYFLYSAQLTDIIPPVFKTHIFLGQEIRKKKQAKELLTSHFFCCQFGDTQNSVGKGASGFCKKFQPAVLIIPRNHSSG